MKIIIHPSSKSGQPIRTTMKTILKALERKEITHEEAQTYLLLLILDATSQKSEAPVLTHSDDPPVKNVARAIVVLGPPEVKY